MSHLHTCIFIIIIIFCMGGPSCCHPLTLELLWSTRSLRYALQAATHGPLSIFLRPCFRSGANLWIPQRFRKLENRVFLFPSRRKHLTHAHVATPSCKRKRNVACEATQQPSVCAQSPHCHTRLCTATGPDAGFSRFSDNPL